MTNDDIAAVLRDIALLVELAEDNTFRARAFESAARAVERHAESVALLAREGRVHEVRGVGSTISRTIEEVLSSGKSSLRDELAAAIPPRITELLAIPGLGPKRIRRLWKELGVTTIEELEASCRDGRITALSGFGGGIRDKVLRGIEYRRSVAALRLLSEAESVYEECRALLLACPEVRGVEAVGDYRRGARTLTGVEILVCAQGAALPAIRAALASFGDEDGSAPPLEAPWTLARRGVRVVVHAADESTRGSALLRLTGSERHLRLLGERGGSAPGLLASPHPGESEEALYRSLGLPWIAPELREGAGELEAAAEGRLPRLLRREDLRGVIHVHTTASDGALTLAALAEECIRRGYAWVCVSDHSRSAAYAGGLQAERLLRQREEARELDAALRPFRVFHGVESDILADGSLDYPDEILDELDFVIGSIHSGLTMAPEQATRRLVSAIANRHLTVLGHPSGALLGRREGYGYDAERILAALSEQGAALEHNCNPARLDPDWPVLRRAKELGLRVALSPDAHDAAGLDDVRFGLVMARKAWLEPPDVLNCLDADEMEEWLRDRARRPRSSS